jgi:hypothetical protein
MICRGRQQQAAAEGQIKRCLDCDDPTLFCTAASALESMCEVVYKAVCVLMADFSTAAAPDTAAECRPLAVEKMCPTGFRKVHSTCWHTNKPQQMTIY